MFDDEGDGVHNGVGFIGIARIFATQDDSFHRLMPFDRVYISMVVEIGTIGLSDATK